jgi:outer membrane lipoprotein-sorting protein
LRTLALLAALGLGLAAPAGAAPSPEDPWSALDRLRRAMAGDRGLVATFVQTFTPAGFASGEVESGRVAISLPDCLRWDYTEPYAKSFLICGARAFSWVEGEPRGQRTTIEARHEMGLDLLLLPIAELRSRYRVSAESTAERQLDMVLEPLAADSPLAAANLAMDADATHLVALEYRDREGNVTSFRFSGYRPLDDPEVFTPPAGIEWQDP